MTQGKHTPGPWKFGVRKDKSMWLSIGDPATGPHYQGDLYASEDDARLIAAAPEMLEALRDALGAIRSASRALSEEHKLVLGGKPWGGRDIVAIEAVIAKAEGW